MNGMSAGSLPFLPFRVSRVVFEVMAIDELCLPEFSGSALRGAFGHALRGLACMTRAPSCDGCPLRRSCPYPRLFEPSGADLSGVGLVAASLTPSPPFAVEPPEIGRRTVAAGEIWRFGMRLFGRSVDDLNLIVEAWRRALFRGLSTRKSRGQLNRVMVETESGWKDLYDLATQTMGSVKFIFDRGGPSTSMSTPDVLTVNLITPLRIQSNAHRVAVADLTFHRLCKDILRRVRLLTATAGEDRSVDLLRAWRDQAWLEQVQGASLEPELRWFDWERTSSRQGRAIRVGGWLGKFRVKNATEIGIAILNMGEAVGLGKECVFGFGQFEQSEGVNSQEEDATMA